MKGNISAGGERIYHLPGSRDYERTRINDRAGERLFCSEDEAKAAGWRATRG
ncbi:nuclease [Methylorubrum extorquens]|uniref:Nuclease n=1 Tax=Methylorubrum extorquens TaxID=408 RepID=A0A1S1P2L4_METEX|nr:nuclease [Methylorubrum extorquens]